MNPLIQQLTKELRLLWPGLCAGLLCLGLPLAGVPPLLQAAGVAVGLMLLAVRPFGAEFQQNTFTLFLSQPFTRNRLYLVKWCSLVVAVALLLALWQPLAGARKFAWPLPQMALPGHLPWVLAVAVAAVGSGLFFSLLFRHMVAAFWAMVLAPLTAWLLLTGLLYWRGEYDAEAILSLVLNPLLTCYGLACGLGSWLLFRRGQDLDRFNSVTGQSLVLPWGRAGERAMGGRPRSPLMALVLKELGLQQVNLGVFVLLVALYGLAVGLGYWVPNAHRNAYLSLAKGMTLGLMVMLPPVLIGCVAVAEERRLGVAAWHRTLPISNFQQWLAKFLVVWAVTGVLSGLVPHFLAGTPMGRDGITFYLLLVWTATTALWVSSLSKTFLSAFGVTLAVVVTMALVLGKGPGAIEWFLGLFVEAGVRRAWSHNPWNKGLVQLGVLFVLIAQWVCLTRLIFRNMQRVWPGARDVVINVYWALGTVLGAVLLAVLIFYRTWELLMPAPEPGDAVYLAGPVQPKIAGRFQSVLLPDGRLLQIDLREQDGTSRPVFTPVELGNQTGGGPDRWRDFSLGWPRSHAVGQDGTLWAWGRGWNRPEISISSRLGSRRLSLEYIESPRQIGRDRDWQSVVGSAAACQFALKQDGSLWAWGTNTHGQLGIGHTNPVPEPARVGSEADWLEVSTRSLDTIGLKKDGSLWRWGVEMHGGPLYTNLVPTRVDVPAEWRQVRMTWAGAVGVKRDGSLWLINLHRVRFPSQPSHLTYRLGRDHDWKTLGTFDVEVNGLKQDGSLWRILLPIYRDNNSVYPDLQEPTRLSRSTNWIAAGESAALAADGSFIVWPLRPEFSSPPGTRYFLAPSRLPLFAVNLLQETTP